LHFAFDLCYNKDVMKKKITSFFIYFILLTLLLVFIPGMKSMRAVTREKIRGEIRVSDEILVKFKNSEKINCVRILDSDDFYEILESYENNPYVEYAEPNYLYRASIIPSDTYYSNQWYLERIRAPQAWDEIRDSSNIIIAVIDSGIEIDHPDLSDNIWQNDDEIANNGVDDDRNGFIDDVRGWDFISNIPDPSPKFEEGFTEAGILHGTIVAGIVGASGNNGLGVTGITWRTNIMPLRVLNDRGEGKTSEVIRAIDYAIANGANIINFSFVGFGYSRAMHESIKRAYDVGIVVVAAAGNEEGEGEGYSLDKIPMYPACHDGDNGENMVIGVAATDTIDQKVAFSSYGFQCVDIAAPGVSVYSTAVYAPTKIYEGKPFDKYYNGYWSGTSMAAPMVSGAVALIESVNPKIDRDQVIDILLSSADNIGRLNPNFLGQLGSGRLNIELAVDKAAEQLINQNIKILTSPYSNRVSQTKITDYSGETENEFYSYGNNFLGGVEITSGDVDGDGIDEIITGAGNGGGPHVRVFDTKGNVKNQFFAYAPNFRGGVHVASGDVDGDGIDEIITGAGNGGGPQVRIFNLQGNVQGQFFAYDSRFRGGVRVAVADNGGRAARGKDRIITAAGPGGGPHIRIFDNHANLKGQFFAYDPRFRGGVSVAAGDIDNDGLIEIVTGAGPGGTPHVRIFEMDGKIIKSFYAYEEKFDGGVNVSIIEVKN